MVSEADWSWEILQPKASPVFEALRAVGYTPETAISDLIDNSIAAQAKNVQVAFLWNDGDPYVVVKGGGSGISERGLTNAMRLGSKSAAEERRRGDLRRFEHGLKTASTSQTREFSVVTCAEAGRLGVVRRWDLDKGD